ncbi:ABC-type transport auxiliary lipoprotein family protein [Arenimonas fontis]|uniref:ABC transporter n=1 Tax=Arenimonas fontis TaxID=2608255 RepID=A0A5B2ZDP5_9GAMM|nr:ABC-type transport auxiliary lipoprotein family protein [Arenimonas fontis]KAA2285344.1 ABC transporter [Arenimonas fontis]
MIRRLCAFALAMLLTGCLGLGGPKTVVQVYSPMAPVQADPAWPSVDWSVAIGTPMASQTIDSTRIAVRPTPYQVQAYKGARWADTAPEMLQTALVQAFEDSGRFRSVMRLGSSGRGDVLLLTEIRHFETVYADGRPTVVVDVQARLIQRNAGRVASQRFRREVVPASPKVVDIAPAFGQAMSALAADLIAWTLVQGNPGSE